MATPQSPRLASLRNARGSSSDAQHNSQECLEGQCLLVSGLRVGAQAQGQEALGRPLLTAYAGYCGISKT